MRMGQRKRGELKEQMYAQGSSLRINQGKNSKVDHAVGEYSYPNVCGGEQGDPQHVLCSSQSLPYLTVPSSSRKPKASPSQTHVNPFSAGNIALGC